MSAKVIVTAGCSFSTVEQQTRTWPFFLQEQTQIPTIYSGRISVGNGFISRSAIYHLTKALETHQAQDILLGIMWSGRSRFEYFYERSPLYSDKNNVRTMIENPYYKITNTGWSDDASVWLAKLLSDDIGSTILTIEHILRVQYFCKLHNIKYFMTEFYKDAVLPKDEKILKHHEVEYLYKQIDFNNFLPIDNMFDWCLQSGITLDEHHLKYQHPTQEHHKAFVNQVVIPFLIDRGYLNDT